MNIGEAIRPLFGSAGVRVLTGLLLLQGAALYFLADYERVPNAGPLSVLPQQLADWRMTEEGVVEPETASVLRADDLLLRSYASGKAPRPVSLFVAFFRSQSEGKAPHSPKNCLPGSGWTPTESNIIEIPVPGRSEQIEVNHYLVAKGTNKSVVIYWYQSPGRVVASEYMAKIYLVWDAITRRRTDTALVRVVVPVTDERPEHARQVATEFIQSLYPALRTVLPV